MVFSLNNRLSGKSQNRLSGLNIGFSDHSAMSSAAKTSPRMHGKSLPVASNSAASSLEATSCAGGSRRRLEVQVASPGRVTCVIIDVPRAIRLIRKNLAQVTRTARARAGDWKPHPGRSLTSSEGHPPGGSCGHHSGTESRRSSIPANPRPEFLRTATNPRVSSAWVKRRWLPIYSPAFVAHRFQSVKSVPLDSQACGLRWQHWQHSSIQAPTASSASRYAAVASRTAFGGASPMRRHSTQPWIIQRSIPGHSALSFLGKSRSFEATCARRLGALARKPRTPRRRNPCDRDEQRWRREGEGRAEHEQCKWDQHR